MKTNQINAAALANTAREVIAMCDNKKYTVAKIIAHWNLCVEQAGMTGTFDCPTCYKRKASIVGDMQRIALQLDRIADDRDPLTGDRNYINDPRCDDEGNDPREWCGNDIETAHAEALEIDERRDLNAAAAKMNKEYPDATEAYYFTKPSCEWREAVNELGHLMTDAFEINTQVDCALANLCRAIAGVRVSSFGNAAKRSMIGAACRGVVDGLRQRLNVVISPEALPALAMRAAK